MSEKSMNLHKNKNFKDIIEKEKHKGRNRKRIMKGITGIHASAMYCGFFLSIFVSLDILVFYMLSPSMFVWALSLMITAIVASITSSRLTHFLKKQQWKYSAI